MIRQLVTRNHTFGGTDPGFRIVYLIDGVVEGAEKPGSFGEPKPQTPFDSQVKKGLRKALDDLPPLRFVKNQGAVIAGEQPGVICDGVLLTLGPIRGRTRRVEVGNSVWINIQAGQWLTYVLERRGRGWEVVGTTGPVAIS